MGDLNNLFQQFLRERRYLQNITPKAVGWDEAAPVLLENALGGEAFVDKVPQVTVHGGVAQFPTRIHTTLGGAPRSTLRR